MKRTSTDSMHLPIDDAQHQLQVLGDPRFPAFITSQSRYQPVPAGLGDKDGGSGGVLLGIGPVRVLEDHQYRAEPGQGLHLGNKRFQSSLSAQLGGRIERRIASVVRQRQHLGK
jgi:hypothetical protein